MTDTYLDSITILRSHNYSYAAIGRALNLSANTVKSVCRRTGIRTATSTRKTKAENDSITVCRNCGKPLMPTSSKRRQFCSEQCRYTYWNQKRSTKT